MLKNLSNALGLTDPTQSSAGPSDFRMLLERASRTQPNSNITPLRSLDQLAKTALSITSTVVDCTTMRDKLVTAYKDAKDEAEAYLDQLKIEFEGKITEADVALAKAVHERKEAQWRLVRQQIELGVFEGIKDLNELARSKEFA